MSANVSPPSEEAPEVQELKAADLAKDIAWHPRAAAYLAPDFADYAGQDRQEYAQETIKYAKRLRAIFNALIKEHREKCALKIPIGRAEARWRIALGNLSAAATRTAVCASGAEPKIGSLLASDSDKSFLVVENPLEEHEGGEMVPAWTDDGKSRLAAELKELDAMNAKRRALEEEIRGGCDPSSPDGAVERILPTDTMTVTTITEMLAGRQVPYAALLMCKSPITWGDADIRAFGDHIFSVEDGIFSASKCALFRWVWRSGLDLAPMVAPFCDKVANRIPLGNNNQGAPYEFIYGLVISAFSSQRPEVLSRLDDAHQAWAKKYMSASVYRHAFRAFSALLAVLCFVTDTHRDLDAWENFYLARLEIEARTAVHDMLVDVRKVKAKKERQTMKNLVEAIRATYQVSRSVYTEVMNIGESRVGEDMGKGAIDGLWECMAGFGY